MDRCVEMKAPIFNFYRVFNRVKEVTRSLPLTIRLHDLFYSVCNGRMKIRTYEDGNADLIYYERHLPVTGGPIVKQYFSCSVSPPQDGSSVKDIFARSLGVRGEVVSTRHLFCFGQTLIRLEFIEGLGGFIELEVMLGPVQTQAEGQNIAYKIMKEVGVSDEELLTGIYIDLLVENNI